MKGVRWVVWWAALLAEMKVAGLVEQMADCWAEMKAGEMVVLKADLKADL